MITAKVTQHSAPLPSFASAESAVNPTIIATADATGASLSFLGLSEQTEQTFKERAAILQALGIPLIPLKPRTKDPITKHAAKDGTLDSKIIQHWIKKYPEYNCAAVAHYDGFWFLDDDQGTLAETYKAETGQDFPATFTVRTSRGYHYYFRHDDASRLVRYGGKKENSGVIEIPGYKGEARCNNQYVVGPGSVHPSGSIYEIYDDVPVIVAPVALVEWLQRAYAAGESLKARLKEAKRQESGDSGFKKLFDVVGYKPLLNRINALRDHRLHISDLDPGKTVPCPMPDHKHVDYTPCFGSLISAPEVLHCLGNCGWSGDMVAAVAKLGGYPNQYAAAKAVCREEGLTFEDFFPPTHDPGPHELIDRDALPSTLTKELEFHLPAVTTRSHRDYVVAPAQGQKDGWFPLGDPSLVGGASGTGKTTLMIDMLVKQASQIPFLGHETYGRPYLVLMFDRGANANRRTLERMHLNPDWVPIKFLPLLWGTAASQAIVDKIEETNPLPQIVFIEGCDLLVKDASKAEIVAPFMRELQKIAEHYHVAIIGSVGAPKAKSGEGYTAKRDNLFGSAVWSRESETVVLLQYPSGDDTSQQREVTVLPRNAAAESFTVVWKDGLFEVNADSVELRNEEPREIRWFKEQARLAKQDPTKKWWTILDGERALEVSHATMDRWVKNAYAKKHIVMKSGKRVGHGGAAQYQWNESNSNPLWVAEKALEEEEALL